MTDAVKKMREFNFNWTHFAERHPEEILIKRMALGLSPLLAKVESEMAALKEPMECGHPHGCCIHSPSPPNGKTGFPFKPNEGELGHHDYNSEGGYVEPCQCTACEHERLAVAAALEREAAYLITCNQDTAADVIRHRIPPADRSTLDAHDAEVRDRALEEAAIEAYAAYKPGDGDTQFKASAAANRIRALKDKK